jgi:hypothetical protein
MNRVLVCCDTVCSCNWLPTFRKNVPAPYSGSSPCGLVGNYQNVGNVPGNIFTAVRTTNLKTQDDISDPVAKKKKLRNANGFR